MIMDGGALAHWFGEVINYEKYNFGLFKGAFMYNNKSGLRPVQRLLLITGLPAPVFQD